MCVCVCVCVREREREREQDLALTNPQRLIYHKKNNQTDPGLSMGSTIENLFPYLKIIY